ncbi:MAG: hypothetical protein U1F10_01755 [Burkholderiales bacterium]
MPDPSSQTVPAQGLPIPYITAAWAGMSYDDIVAGLAAGSILPPPGAAAGWLPQPGTVGVAYSPATASLSSATADSQGSDAATNVVPARADVARWFGMLDPTLTPDAFDAIWQRAGSDDAHRAEQLTGYLGRVLLGAPAGSADGKKALADTSLALDAFLADPAHRAHVVDLASMSGSDMATEAATDVGYRYALAHMDSVALAGNRTLFAAGNADGALDRFDRDTGEPLVSNAWLEDRGKFLAWKLARDQGAGPTVSGHQDWTFVDRAATGADGSPLTLELRTGASDAGHNQVIFGTQDTDVMKGVAGSDRLYGGAGDDVLLGGMGGDHLEGGAGADVVMGGGGDDELVGNQGDDEMDGGSGNDTLQAGSGDDILTGGRGKDRLEGGAGHDTYVIDAGDGADTIMDGDGYGAIQLEGATLAGRFERNERGGWSTADGRVDLSFDGNAAEGGTLTLHAFAQGASHDAAPDNVVTVKDWKNGDLGITLSGGLDTTQSVAEAAPAATSTGSQDGAAVAAEQGAIAATGDSAGEGAIAASNGHSPDTDTAVAMAPGGDVPATTDAGLLAETGAAGVGDVGSAVAATDESGSSAATTTASPDTFDFDTALASLFSGDGASINALDPAALQRGVDAFAGVLSPPDISDVAAASADSATDGITGAHLADALAADTAGSDFHAEVAMGPEIDAAAMRATDALAARIDKSAVRGAVGVYGAS